MASEFYLVASRFNKQFAGGGEIAQTGAMPRRHAIAVIALSAALSGCGKSEQQEPQPADQVQADNGSDTFSNTVTEAMCGAPDDRAHAVAAVAREPEINSHPDDVYDLASDIAEKGCPKPIG